LFWDEMRLKLMIPVEFPQLRTRAAAQVHRSFHGRFNTIDTSLSISLRMRSAQCQNKSVLKKRDLDMLISGWLPVAIYRATDAILNSKFGHFSKKVILDLILIVEMF
jgi:hypothetical protein